MAALEKILTAFGIQVVDEDAPEGGAAKPRQTREDTEEEETRPRRPLIGRNRTEDVAVEQRRGQITTQAPDTGRGDIFIVQPTMRSDAKVICNELRSRRTVLVNVEDLDEAETQRLFDFVQESVYALDGVIKQVAENVIVVAPHGIDIQLGDAVSEDTRADDYSYVDDDDYSFIQ